MYIVVAGAGAGKTSSMAELVISRLKEITDNKIIYVITYTNAARDRIKEKVLENEGCIPNLLKIETIHSFLLKEVIYPFNHLVYGAQYKSASQIPLHPKPAFKAIKKKELRREHILHVEDVTKTAKHLLCGKNKDTEKIKHRRNNALKMLSRYLDSIYVDEAQDMDKDFSEVLTMLANYNINVNLIGDPKQDLRNRAAFRDIIAGDLSVDYKSENHRCPSLHVDFSNSFISKAEHQTSTKEEGTLRYLLESNSTIQEDIKCAKYDLAYIYQRNDRFKTHREDVTKTEEQLSYELTVLARKASSVKQNNLNQVVYVLKKKTVNSIKRGIPTYKIFSGLEKELTLSLDKYDKGKIGSAVNAYHSALSSEPGILVDSIDAIKGLEGYNCLFIISTQLAPYLFKEVDDYNKMRNYLYVALTRSIRDLTMLLTTEVEKKYGHKYIHEQLNKLGIAELKT
ncbi:UvrD-helicase domain-containing protein [Mangrovibacillus sp. Mu-81]|uniref:UvrD-helicase domain-containing protein n=1 Tax=Bacillaceae TaxID=186817 RepID=UPI00249546EF|nr:UvrD-helicase domain-containing protein [Rossellomorea aquimaris]